MRNNSLVVLALIFFDGSDNYGKSIRQHSKQMQLLISAPRQQVFDLIPFKFHELLHILVVKPLELVEQVGYYSLGVDHLATSKELSQPRKPRNLE